MNVDTQTSHITGIACLEVANTQRIMILLDIQSLMGSADMELKNSIDQ